MNDPMLSIITPVYNGEKFIEACIKNVIEQNYPHSEHIIVDGNSSDCTLEIVKKYAEKHPHIRWVSEKDKGQSDAMNKGIALARGQILGILNYDDFYEPNVFKRVLEIFKTLPNPSLLVGNCNVWYANGELKEVNRPSRLKLSELLLGIKVNPCPLNPSAYFYHKSVHTKIGPYKIMYYSMDIDFLLRAVQVATVKYVDEVWGNFVLQKDCKTYREMESETSYIRHQNIIKSYRKDVPLLQRICVAIKYELYYKENIHKITSVFNRLRYYLKRPLEAPAMIRRKLNNFFNAKK